MQKNRYHVLGPGLRNARAADGRTQEEVAAAAGLSRPVVVKAERGGGVRLDSFLAIAAVLGREIHGRSLPPGANIGERLGKLRERHRISVRGLSGIAGVSAPTVAALERGVTGIRLPIVEQVAGVLGAGLFLGCLGKPSGFACTVGASSAFQAWTTPPDVVARVVDVLGAIDLDPCSPTRSRQTAPVPAGAYYTEEDDGLSLPWYGRVYANPPYGRALPRWVAKCREEADAGRARPVLALIPARSDTRYFHQHVAGVADILFLRGRLAFGSVLSAAPFPSAFILWNGDDGHRDRLRSAFPDGWLVPAT